MARIDAGAIATESRWTHPSEIVAAARDQVEQALQAHKLDVTIEPDVPGPAGSAADRDGAGAPARECRAVFAAGIADRRSARGVADDGLVIQVRDHGPGIAPADLPHLFERFYRGAAAKSRTSGTGMGLWIVRGLLAVEHGRVWAENCAGRRRAVHHRGAGAVKDDAGGSEFADMIAHRPRILLVDDEVAIQRAVGPLLRSRGYEVDIAGTGAEALAMFAERHAGSDRARPRVARPRRHRSRVAAFGRPRRCRSSCCRRAGGGRQGERARSRRRRLRHQAVRSGGAAGAHSGGAAAGRVRRAPSRPACCEPATSRSTTTGGGRSRRDRRSG